MSDMIDHILKERKIAYAVFDQDFSNLPMIHKGLHSLQSGQIELANYQEVRIRHFHQVLDKYLNADQGEEQ